MEFGMYVDPVVLTQRHTLYDSDEEETETVKDKVTISLTSPSNSGVPINEGGTLLVAVGSTASIFAKSYPLLVADSNCIIVANSQTVFQGRHFPPRGRETGEKMCDDAVHLSEVYAVRSKASGGKGSCFVCVHENPLKPDYCNTWAAKVFECLHPTTVVVLTSRPSQEHFSPHVVKSDPFCMLRCLQSSSWCHSPLVPTFLEPPNTIAGEAAAILTHCEIHKLPASLVVLYSDSAVSTGESMSALRTILEHPLLSESMLITPTDEALRKAKQLVPKPRHDLGTLYT